MDQRDRIEALAAWSDSLTGGPGLENMLDQAEMYNPWFRREDSRRALDAIAAQYLNREKLEAWLADFDEPESTLTVGLVPAANIPLVGFHDLLCILASGHRAQIRLSARDRFLLPYLIDELARRTPELGKRVEFRERLEDFDAIIATGSDNSARYFKQYFGKWPHIIRKNRISAAVLNGSETPEELQALGEDVFAYFGLGCRSVAKLFVPKDYEVTRLFEAFAAFSPIIDHNKYKNNYDYNRTLLILNHTEHLANEFFMLVESAEQQHSPIATLHYERYSDSNALDARLTETEGIWQCVVGKGPQWVPFGKAQQPGLGDWADGVNTLDFLQEAARQAVT